MFVAHKSGLELALQRELANRKKVSSPNNEVVKTLTRSPSFGDWTNACSSKVQSSMEHPKLTFPSPRPQFHTVQSLIKIEPYSDEISSLINPSSPHKDWINPSKLFDKKLLTYNSSSELPLIPAKTPPRKAILIPKTDTETQRPIYFPGQIIPTKPRSSLKRKQIDIQELLNPPPAYSNNNSSKPVNKSPRNLFCELCQVSCSSGTTMQDHLRGRPHKAKLVWMQLKTRNCTVKQPKCNVCQIFCSDRDTMEMHLKGRKHKAKLHELEECRRNGTGGVVAKKKPVFCELCHVSCMNEDCFEMHLRGKQHATRQEMKRRGMI
ncbi:hypothetical protein ABFX02_04G153400 [Erythranthe guttata]